MKRVFFILSLIAVGAGCARVPVEPSNPSNQPSPAAAPVQPLVLSQMYRNAAHGYTFSYSGDMVQLDAAIQDADIALQLPSSLTAGTNLNDNAMRVKALANAENQEFQTCRAHTNPYTGIPLTEIVTQDGMTFYHYAIEDAGAGHKYVYQGYYGYDALIKTCFHFSLALDVSNPDVYDPAIRPRVFDETRAVQIFDQLFHSFVRAK